MARGERVFCDEVSRAGAKGKRVALKLFTHHQAVLIGHLRALDLLRQHCERGSADYKLAHSCITRAEQMFLDLQKISTSFVCHRQFASSLSVRN